VPLGDYYLYLGGNLCVEQGLVASAALSSLTPTCLPLRCAAGLRDVDSICSSKRPLLRAG